MVYINSVYGLYFSFEIQSKALDHGINVVSVSISDECDLSYHDAADKLKKLGVFIVVLVVHATDGLFNVLDDEGMIGYPYFYIGTDGWFGMRTITDWNATKQTEGLIGIVPYQVTYE